MTRICETTNVAELNGIWKYFVNFVCREVTKILTFVSFVLGACVIFANPDFAVFGIMLCGVSFVCTLANFLEVGNPFHLVGLSLVTCGSAILLLLTMADWRGFSICIFASIFSYLCTVRLISVFFQNRISRRRVEIILGARIND